MVQGALKKSAVTTFKSSSASAHKSNAGITKKHLAVKPSKKARIAKATKINKKFTSGLTAQTERMLGEKAGHLEMIGKGRTKKEDKGKHGKKGGETRVGKKS